MELVASHEYGATRDQIRVAATCKRPSEADASKWVIGECFTTDRLPDDTPRTSLAVALDLPRPYEQMLRSLIPLPARAGEGVDDQRARLAYVRNLERDCVRLEARIRRENTSSASSNSTAACVNAPRNLRRCVDSHPARYPAIGRCAGRIRKVKRF